MRLPGIVFVWVVCTAAVGCNSDFMVLTFHNFEQFPLLASDEVRMSCRNRQRADEAWHLITMGAEKEFSKDHAAGFKAGYADYLDNGGNGEPPATPPYCYRTVKYQSAEGVEAINEWYTGWRHGSTMAKASGVREVEVVPLSAPPINAVDRYGPPIALPASPSQLPAPRIEPSPDK